MTMRAMTITEDHRLGQLGELEAVVLGDGHGAHGHWVTSTTVRPRT